MNSAQRAHRLAVFAVEDTAAQVCWASLPPGEVTIDVGDHQVAVAADGEPGAVAVEGLSPGTSYTVVARSGRRSWRAGHFTTLEPPPGKLLYRLGTVNDLHLGERNFGLLPKLREPKAIVEPYPLRCARAALAEALSWGARRIVAKGDLTWSGRPAQWEAVGSLLGDLPVPVHAVLGNHDVGSKAVDGTPFLSRHGIGIATEPEVIDVPGLRVVLAHSVVPRKSHGEVDAVQLGKLVEAVGNAPGAAFLAMHHYPQRFRWPNVYPPGIPGPMANAMLDAIAEANPATIVTSGHSHRHRRHRHGPLVIAEIGSTKDYPGAWAGYAVHEGGILQVVRRVADPSAIAWTERTRRVMLGIWGMWSPGIRSHRCFTHQWPERHQ